MTREKIIKSMLELEPIKNNKDYTQYLLNELRLIRWKQEYQRNKPDPLRDKIFLLIRDCPNEYITIGEIKEKTGATSQEVSSRITRLIKDEMIERKYYYEKGAKCRTVAYKVID